MKEEQLKKLYDLMEGLLMTYSEGYWPLEHRTYDGVLDDEEIQNEIYELDRIIYSCRVDKKVNKDDLIWSNEIWKKYKRAKPRLGGKPWNYKSDYRIKQFNRIHIRFYSERDVGFKGRFKGNDDFIMKERCFGIPQYKGIHLVGVKKDGLLKKWYFNGLMKAETNYKNGKRDGLHIEYLGGDEEMFAPIRGLICVLDYYEDDIKVKKVAEEKDNKGVKINWVEFKNKLKVIVSDDGKSIKEIIKL